MSKQQQSLFDSEVFRFLWTQHKAASYEATYERIARNAKQLTQLITSASNLNCTPIPSSFLHLPAAAQASSASRGELSLTRERKEPKCVIYMLAAWKFHDDILGMQQGYFFFLSLMPLCCFPLRAFKQPICCRRWPTSIHSVLYSSIHPLFYSPPFTSICFVEERVWHPNSLYRESDGISS